MAHGNRPDTAARASGIGAKQPLSNMGAMRMQACKLRRLHCQTKYGTTVMHGQNSKFARAALSALLYTQALLIGASVMLVVMKDHAHVAAPMQIVSVASSAAPSL